MKRYDRTGEPVDDELPELPHDARCRSGWLGDDLDGRPVPCLICRPHLAGHRTNVHHHDVR